MTLANIPADLDAELKYRAVRAGKSVPDLAEQVLRSALGMPTGANSQKRDLSKFLGSWDEDPELDAILAEFRQVNPNTWR